MNYKRLLLVIGIISAVVAAVNFFAIKEKKQPKILGTASGVSFAKEYLKSNWSPILSPDKSKKIIIYFLDEQELENIISVVELDSDYEKYIYIGKNIGFPKWLGNDHIFFTKYCGTACQGFILVEVNGGEVRSGILSYMSLDLSRPDYTHFKDWFGSEFEFDGYPESMRGEIKDDKAWLVFAMHDQNKKPLGEKRFIFTGDGLKE